MPDGTNIPTGKCCMGKLCLFPSLELRAEHTCPKCNQIVHTLCGEFDELTDKYVCKSCCESSKMTTEEAKATDDMVPMMAPINTLLLPAAKPPPLCLPTTTISPPQMMAHKK